MNISRMSKKALARAICDRLNSILHGREVYRDGVIVPYPEVKPKDILKRVKDKAELEFYYWRLCR